MRHALIYKSDMLIDDFIDTYKTARHRRSFPHQAAAKIITLLFPGSAFSGRRAWKMVHRVSSRERDLVLKTANPRSLYQDWRVYRRLPASAIGASPRSTGARSIAFCNPPRAFATIEDPYAMLSQHRWMQA